MNGPSIAIVRAHIVPSQRSAVASGSANPWTIASHSPVTQINTPIRSRKRSTGVHACRSDRLGNMVLLTAKIT